MSWGRASRALRRGRVWPPHWLAVFLLLASIAAWASPATSDGTRVVFVGNSLTYFYGVPYLFEEVARDVYGEQVSVDSLLQGGGRLAQVASSPASMQALSGAGYDVVVLQENGGSLLCGADRDGRETAECQESLTAHRLILDTAGDDSARGILLGTYQANRSVPQALVAGEAWFATELALHGYASVALPVLHGKERHNNLPWFAEDGMHPSPAASLLIAAAVGKAVFGEPPPTWKLTARMPYRTPAMPLTYDWLVLGTEAFQSREPLSVGPAGLVRIYVLLE